MPLSIPPGSFAGEEYRFINGGTATAEIDCGDGTTIEVWPGGVVWFCWNGTSWQRDTGGSRPYSLSGFGPYQPETGFPVAPRDLFKVVYIRSGGVASVLLPRVNEQGSDIIGTGTMLSPLASLWGCFMKFGRLIEEGYHLLIKPAGGLTSAEIAAGVNPWYGQCSSIRQYPMRGADVKGTEAYVGSWSVEGPLLGAKVPMAFTVVNVEPLGELSATNNGRSRWRYNGNTAPYATPQNGTMLRVRRAGRLVSFEMQVTKSVPDGNPANGYVYTDCGNFTNGGVFDVQGGDVVDFITHAAEFIPTSRADGVDSGVGGADGIGLTGFAAANPMGRLTNGANWRSTWTMCGFENLNIRKFVGSFDRCYVYHQFNCFDSAVSWRGSSINSQVPSYIINSETNVGPGPGSVDDQCGHYPEVGANYDEYQGDLSAADALLLKPINLSTGGVSLYNFYVTEASAGGLVVQGGRLEPRWGMTFVGGLILQGGARFVQQTPAYPVLFRVVHSNPAGDAAALLVKGDSVAIVDPHNLTFDDVDNDMGLGTGDPINRGNENGSTVGSFLETAGWNGHFCRYAVTGGFPTGDFSAIRDFNKYPA